MKNYKISEEIKRLNTYSNRNLWLRNYYNEKLIGKNVINKHLGIKIKLSKISRNETVFGPGRNTRNKIVVVSDLLYVLKNAKFVSWKNPKPKHIKKHKAIGFINLRYECKIEGVKRRFRIPIMVKNDGSFQYHLSEYR